LGKSNAPTAIALVLSFVLVHQSAGAKELCVDMTQGRLMGLEYYSCRLAAMYDRATIDNSKASGRLDGYDFPKSSECIVELRTLADKAAKDTSKCLEKTKQTRALEALEDYYGSWLAHTRLWRNTSMSGEEYTYRMKRGEEALEEKRARLQVTIK
jgi:hypothetical protein